jgi:hypothetical protein
MIAFKIQKVSNFIMFTIYMYGTVRMYMCSINTNMYSIPLDFQFYICFVNISQRKKGFFVSFFLFFCKG